MLLYWINTNIWRNIFYGWPIYMWLLHCLSWLQISFFCLSDTVIETPWSSPSDQNKYLWFQLLHSFTHSVLLTSHLPLNFLFSFHPAIYVYILLVSFSSDPCILLNSFYVKHVLLYCMLLSYWSCMYVN